MATTDGARWILVDVGQVLIAFDHAVISARLVGECFPADRRSARERQAVEAFIRGPADGPSPNSEVDRGTQNIEWLCARVCDEFGIAVDLARFEEIWTSIFAPQVNADVVACVEALRADGVRVGICSNTNAAHWRFLRRQHAALRRLAIDARCFLSFEMGQGKGDPGFFERIAEATQEPAGNHLLLDDRAEHCDAARAAGMRAVHFDPMDTARCLREVNLLVKGGVAHGE